MRTISENDILGFRKYLTDSEKSQATISKYTYDVRCFICWLNGREAEKAEVVGYKQYLQSAYAPASVNSMLSSVNSLKRAPCSSHRAADRSTDHTYGRK